MKQKFGFLVKIKLLLVSLWIIWLNSWIVFFQKFLFWRKQSDPHNILIYKVGNIGDIICAVPSFVAIRKFYPNSKITLLTSPGKLGAPGAKEILNGVKYVDDIKIYYSDDVSSFIKIKKFINDLKVKHYDFFIQLPDDLVNFKTVVRNLFFAKIIGVKRAIGFKVRTVHLFKKTQVDNLFRKTEVENLIEILKENGINYENIEFDFNIEEYKQKKIDNVLTENFGLGYKNDLIIAINPAGKRDANKWPIERYIDVGNYIKNKYGAKFVIIGGRGEFKNAEVIKRGIFGKVLNLTELEIVETMELMKKCLILLSNDTGAVHMASAVGLPVVGIYSVRNIFGSWFPYGQNHKILYHKFMDCDYMEENCIKRSVNAVSSEEAMLACDQIIKYKLGKL